MLHRITCGTAALIAAVAGLSQVAATEFEVASIRPNKLNDRIVSIHVGPGDRFTARGYTLVLLMQRAYGVMDWNVTGGPPWIRADRWDVAAKANVTGDLTENQLQPMLKGLLADRFKLKLHKDSREMFGYALVVARGGPKMTAAASGEERRDTFRMVKGQLSGQGISMETLARFVAGKLGFVAVDQTGLKGLYDFDVRWNERPDETAGADPRDALRSAVLAALQDQLGLKMIPRKITIQTIVIDSVEKASEN